MRSCVRCWDLRRTITTATADVADEPLCAACADDLSNPAAAELRDVAYELRRAELEEENRIAKARMDLAMRCRSARRVEVPLGGLFAAQPGLFD